MTRRLPLTGVYDKAVNGVYECQVVLNFNARDNSFILAQTRESELEKLRERFDGLAPL